jgi:hypothetical protein
MLVANKFQTGFDQPLLCAMYVDKRLSGVTTVQTPLTAQSHLRQRAARTPPMYWDFVNDPACDPRRLQDLLPRCDAFDKMTDRHERRWFPRGLRRGDGQAIPPLGDDAGRRWLWRYRAPHPRRPSIPGLAHDKRCLMAPDSNGVQQISLPHRIASHRIAARALGRSGHCGGRVGGLKWTWGPSSTATRASARRLATAAQPPERT